VTSGTSADLYDVHFGSATSGVAVGEGGALLKTSDGGITWSAASTGGFADDLVSVRFASATVAVASSDMTVLRSTDGGSNWAIVAGPQGGQVRFASNTVGVIAQQAQLFRTTDGGATWSAPFNYGSGNQLAGALDFDSSTTGRALFDSLTGRRYGSTSDGGVTWTLGGLAPPFLSSTFGKTNAGTNRWIIGAEVGSVFVVSFQ
jgi:hypothetical protein